jgi:hypothetical protein
MLDPDPLALTGSLLLVGGADDDALSLELSLKEPPLPSEQVQGPNIPLLQRPSSVSDDDLFLPPPGGGGPGWSPFPDDDEGWE